MALSNVPMNNSVYLRNVLVLVLLLVLFPVGVEAVTCLHCAGNLPGCAGTNTCPFIVDTAANAAALVSATAATITLASLLPTKVLRVIPRAAMDALKALVKAKTAPAIFDPTGKDADDIFQAYGHGEISSIDAQIALGKIMGSATASQITRIAALMGTIKEMAQAGNLVPDKASMVQGAYLYVWAITGKCVSDQDVVGLPESSSSESKAGPNMKIGRPATLSEFMGRLNFWVMLCHAVGLGNVMQTTKFLEEVVYAPLRMGKDCKIIHELLVVYLQAVADVDKYNLGNVYDTGGQDTKWREAEASAVIHFRVQRGDPAATGGPTKPWDCACTGAVDKFCISFNLKRDHKEASLDANGKCKYKHACDAWIKDANGNKTVCGSTQHSRADCPKPKWTGA